MRGTLHLMLAEDLPLYVAASSSTRDSYTKPAWLKYHGVTLDEIRAIIAAVPEVLDGRVLTREELADAIATATHSPHIRELLLSGWGALLKPAAYHGYLCFGPESGAQRDLYPSEVMAGRLAGNDCQRSADEHSAALPDRLRSGDARGLCALVGRTAGPRQKVVRAACR
ncbi:MAG: crosslink repair DNA glycosylase YcaQ family protein [Anaerolineae bacterium]